MRRIQNVYKVVSNDKLSPRFLRLCLHAPEIVKQIQPGQFIHIKVNDSLEPLFRRPFSVYRAKKYVEIIYEPVGTGTRYLAEKKNGDSLDVLGPLGVPFAPPPEGTKQIVMIAGGIGIAPFLVLSDQLKGKYEMILLYGARTKGHVYPMKEFKANGCKVFVATEDGGAGVKGRVTRLFSKIKRDPRTTYIYTCGPTPMMAAVQQFVKENNLRGQVSCEEVMACALGACLGCSIQTTSGYKTCCYDGPVFDLREVVF